MSDEELEALRKMQAHFKEGPWGFVLQQCIEEIERLRAADTAAWDAAVEAAANTLNDMREADGCHYVYGVDPQDRIRALKRSKT